MPNVPFFSVVIPLYNKERYIKATLKSVLDQTFENFEVIIVDDGSTDQSASIVKKFVDDRIRFLHQKNQGVSYSRNNGIKQATSKFIAFLDADDLWHKNHLEVLHNLITQFPKASMFSTAYLMSFENNDKLAKFNGVSEGFIGVVDDFFKSNLEDSIVNSSVACIKKTVLEDVGGFDTNIKSGEDTDLWVNIALQYKVAFHNMVTATIVKNDSRLSHNYLITDRIKFLDKYKEQEKTNSSLKSFLDMNRYSTAVYLKIINENLARKTVYNSINKENLSTKQKIVYRLPSYILKTLYKLKKELDKKGVFFHLYK